MIFRFFAKRWSYLVLLLGLAIYGNIQRHAPRTPDVASGHVIAETVPLSRRHTRHVIYLDSSERTLYRASVIVMVIGALGVFAHLATNRNLKSTP